MTTILDTIESDHQELKKMLKSVLETGDGNRRAESFAQFKTAMTAHSRGEEQVLYQPLAQKPDAKSEALESIAEHQVAEHLIEELAADRNAGADTWTARCTVLQELVEHHIKDEETKLFPMVQKVFDQSAQNDMNKRFMEVKAQHGMPAR